MLSLIQCLMLRLLYRLQLPFPALCNRTLRIPCFTLACHHLKSIHLYSLHAKRSGKFILRSTWIDSALRSLRCSLMMFLKVCVISRCQQHHI
jgi:hypothetical protein